MNIKNNLVIWVEKVEPSGGGEEWFLWGDCFDGDSGFGRENIYAFEGKALFVSAAIRKIAHVELVVAHVARRGWGWRLSGPASPTLSTPFLVTDDLDVRYIESGELLVQASPELKRQFERYGSGGSYLIGSREWFGILNHGGSESTGELIVFSSSSRGVEEGDEISLLEWEWPAGRIIRFWPDGGL